MSTLACLLMVVPGAKQFWGCSAMTDGKLTPDQSNRGKPASKPPRAAGCAARHNCIDAAELTEWQHDKLSPFKCRDRPGGAADRAAAVVHFASEEAGVPADRTAAPRRQLHDLVLRSPIAGREPNAGNVNSSRLQLPEPGQQPSQQHFNGRLTDGTEASMYTEQSDSTEREPVQSLASVAAGPASTTVCSPRGEARTLGRTVAPRRLPPLTIPKQGAAGPTLLSGDWVSCDTELEFVRAGPVLLSCCFVYGEASQHVTLLALNMANHSLQPNATLK